MKLELLHGSRSRILAGVILLAAGIFVVRLFYLQVIQHDYYVKLASEEQVKRLTIPAKRGLIYAMDGDKPVRLVLNEDIYTVFADPQTTKNDDKIIEVIRKVAGGNAQKNLKEKLALKKSRYQVLATRISRSQAELIKNEKLKGIGFQDLTQRVYPEGALAAQVLGFVNYAGEGKYGIESGLNKELTGTDGILQSVTDVSLVPLTIGDKNVKIPAVDGVNQVLSIDRSVQSHAEQALADGLKRTGATNGSILVMNPQNGQVLAMANAPTYKPAEFTKVTDAAAFNNGTISAPYEPGSDIKTLTFAAGIEEGVITPESTFVNTDYITVDDRTISNASKGQTGTITYQHAFNWSLNTGFVTVAERLGDGKKITKQSRDTIYDYFYTKFGLGRLTGIELAGEARGTVVSPDEADGNAVRYSNMAFGQGLDATMIQVASAFSSVINGGNYYKPTVLAGRVDANGVFIALPASKPIRQTISESTSKQMVTALQTARATFYKAFDRQGYVIGGKTGTSQTLRNGVYVDSETVGTYLGFGGTDTPAYVIMVQVSGKDKPLQGGRDALPIFTDMSNWMIDHLKLQPKG
jgi:cell division protein FtsI/penicillin-binding protein 2